MTKSNHLYRTAWLFACILFITLVACEPEDPIQEDAINTPPSATIRVSHDMFVFPDEATFSQTLAQVSGMSELEYSAFLTRYQMNTMKSIYDQVSSGS